MMGARPSRPEGAVFSSLEISPRVRFAHSSVVHRPRHRQARHSHAGPWCRCHHVHGRCREHPARSLEADRLPDADGHDPSRETHRASLAADQGFRATDRAAGHRLRRMGPHRGRCLHGREEGGGAVLRSPGATEGFPLGHQADERRVRIALRDPAAWREQRQDGPDLPRHRRAAAGRHAEVQGGPRL